MEPELLRRAVEASVIDVLPGERSVVAKINVVERLAQPRATGDDRTRVLIRLESQIDDMLHEVKLAGGLSEFEETLRKTRRILVRSHEG